MTISSDPLAIFRISKKGIPNTFTMPDISSENPDEDPLDQYRIKPPEKKEDFKLKDIPKALGGLSARAGEEYLGAAGGFQKGFGSLLDLVIGAPTEYFTGEKHPKLRETLRDPFSALGENRGEIESLERSSLSPGDASSFSRFATSEDFRENITKPASKSILGDEEALEPKSEPERFAQEFTQDLARLSVPGSGVHSWMGRVGLSLAGNSVKEITKQLGFSPSSQELAKLGTLGIVSLAQIGNAPQFARQYFQQTKAMMPRGVRFNTQPLENALNQIRNSQWYRGHPTPSTRAAREMIDSIEARIQSGTLSVQDGMTLRENINELAHNLGAFSVEGTQRVAHVGRLNEVRDALIQGMENTIGRQYPNWWRQYQDANQAFAITQRSSALGNFIANNYARPIVSDAGKILFGNALAKGAAGVAKLGMAGVGITTGAKAIELTNRIAASPTLRRYYSRVVSDAARGDGLALSKSLQRFDEEALKEQKEEKARKVLRNPFQK